MVVQAAPSKRPATLLVADRQPVVHEGLRVLVAQSDGLTIVGHAASARDAVASARRLTPRIVLLDQRLPDMLCEEAVAALRLASPHSRLVIFTQYVTATVLEQAARLSVAGLLGKDATPDRVIDVLLRVAANEVVVERVPDQALRYAAAKLHAEPLTPREHQVVLFAATGATNAEIGTAIHLAPTTVKSYLQSALQKLGARNRAEAVTRLNELELL